MRIENVRFGHATNSSSTHSVVFLRSGVVAEDHDVEEQIFGWDHWTAVSKKAKRSYLGQLIREALTRQAGDEVARTVAEAWTGVGVAEEGNVDHQSELVIPRNFDGKGAAKAFVDDLLQVLDREDVAILGGNDNDDVRHPLAGSPVVEPWKAAWKEEHGEIVARKDGAHWVLFDREKGNKLRLTFDNAQPPYTRASWPELVDVKITDYCTYGCDYCYQDSTERGRHASHQYLRNLACSLHALSVFEVALGGGEPTLHPDFVQILEDFRRWHIVPNFTTRNPRFLSGPDAELVAKWAGAVALSVDHRMPKDLNTALSALAEGPFGQRKRAHVQYVVGASDDAFLGDLVRSCQDRFLQLTLLGHKTVGRGRLGPALPEQTDRWVDIVKAASKWDFFNIGIDTALAAASVERLKSENVPKTFYETAEGAFSMYVDAVAEKAAPSSYCDPSLYQALKYPGSGEVERTFRAFTA